MLDRRCRNCGNQLTGPGGFRHRWRLHPLHSHAIGVFTVLGTAHRRHPISSGAPPPDDGGAVAAHARRATSASPQAVETMWRTSVVCARCVSVVSLVQT